MLDALRFATVESGAQYAAMALTSRMLTSRAKCWDILRRSLPQRRVAGEPVVRDLSGSAGSAARGRKKSLAQCQHAGWDASACLHATVAAVVCRPQSAFPGE